MTLNDLELIFSFSGSEELAYCSIQYCGVLRGSVLGPVGLLFSLYTADVLNIV